MMKQLKRTHFNATNWLCGCGQRCTTCGRTSHGSVRFLIAKARYSRSIKGTKPIFKEDRTVYLPKAYHPLLNRETVVANTIEFMEDIETVIITGPNTGGKTVTLKTLGLIIVMAQSGLLIPTLDGSQLSVFKMYIAISEMNNQ